MLLTEETFCLLRDLKLRLKFVSVRTSVPLVIGSLIYLAFRSNIWLHDGGALINVDSLLHGGSLVVSAVVTFVLYVLPDTLWAYAITSFVAGLWFENSSSLSAWMVIGVLCGVSFELGQFYELFQGCFAQEDLLASVAGSLIATAGVAQHYKKEKSDDSKIN